MWRPSARAQQLDVMSCVCSGHDRIAPETADHRPGLVCRDPSFLIGPWGNISVVSLFSERKPRRTWKSHTVILERSTQGTLDVSPRGSFLLESFKTHGVHLLFRIITNFKHNVLIVISTVISSVHIFITTAWFTRHTTGSTLAWLLD